MNKIGVIVLIVAAVVFTGLGFVIGQVAQTLDNTPGSKDDPLVAQSWVESFVGDRLTTMQSDIDEMRAILASNGLTNTAEPLDVSDSSDTTTGTQDAAYTSVEVTADSVNIRATASQSAEIIGSATSGTVLTYIGSTTASDGTWYHIRTSSGAEGWVAGWLCGDPY
ncbi:MAG: SH3 domain-containing protein [Bacillota bacterium]|nr:SH3 domain-containing protein [Bacillota bacterium]